MYVTLSCAKGRRSLSVEKYVLYLHQILILYGIVVIKKKITNSLFFLTMFKLSLTSGKALDSYKFFPKILCLLLPSFAFSLTFLALTLFPSLQKIVYYVYLVKVI